MTNRARRIAWLAALEGIEKENVPGAIVECGVWEGGNIIKAREICPTRICWLYDTFNGMTRPGPEDDLEAHRRYKPEWLSISLAKVKQNFIDTNTFDSAYLRFIKGPVEQTLRDPENLPDQIAALRLDTDWFASTKIELEILFPRVVPGGVLIVDDYGRWQGARRAVDEYFAKKLLTFKHIDSTAIMAKVT